MRPEPFFSGTGIDRADQVRVDPARVSELTGSRDARQLVWREGLPAVGPDGRLEWQGLTSPDLFLGLQDGLARFSAIEQPHGNARAAFDTIGTLAPDEAPLFAAALSLAWWHSRHRFCANSGHPTELERGGWSRSCPVCGAQHFPRVDPVVIMLAEHDGRLLLGRQPQYPAGRYSALAGFLEPGESIEAAVARELHEEAGIEVADVTYVASQPWPFPSSLMIGCHARALDADLTIDRTELDDARWFTREEIAAALAGEADAAFLPPPRFAIARTLLDHWLTA
ncbi:NAD(+) diphosphatase [Sphingomonas sp. SM33]|uniref:NAD(+) diphosphatase n=1 Tax=Sphingomonas telluris TaxID=2907998 RepID=A0ABS9VNX0_9SPHN|nr:NAD(+) diphosphatase [Sphingomonas telluris]MCH8616398.1 NAD(+) diphosphatase [Sphingomonas telluris]